jgi:hypothetical protein
MSVRGKWRVVETPDHDMAGAGSYILFTNEGGEFALDCLTGQYTAVAKVTPSSSHGTAATRWNLQEAVVGQKSSPMAHLKVRYASKAATTSPLSPADWLLLQQPVSLTAS